MIAGLIILIVLAVLVIAQIVIQNNALFRDVEESKFGSYYDDDNEPVDFYIIEKESENPATKPSSHDKTKQ